MVGVGVRRHAETPDANQMAPATKTDGECARTTNSQAIPVAFSPPVAIRTHPIAHNRSTTAPCRPDGTNSLPRTESTIAMPANASSQEKRSPKSGVLIKVWSMRVSAQPTAPHAKTPKALPKTTRVQRDSLRSDRPSVATPRPCPDRHLFPEIRPHGRCSFDDVSLRTIHDIEHRRVDLLRSWQCIHLTEIRTIGLPFFCIEFWIRNKECN